MTAQRDAQVGKTLGEYRLLRLLGKGTFGAVYQAQHQRLHSPAAVKILRTSLVRHEDFKSFINEARTMRLRHPHIVQVLDFGVSKEDTPYLVMEHAPGGTLRNRYPRGTQLPLPTILAYTTQLAAALQYAHDQHIIHRDVKPENMLVRDDGTLFLSDFGIAKVLESSSLVSMPSFLGTPAYMAPEQSQGKPCMASDQYALAVVLYEWITGQRPFGGSALEVVLQHRLDPPPPLKDRVPDLPPDVEQVVLRALKKDPQERFPSIAEFAQAFQEAVEGSSGQPEEATKSATSFSLEVSSVTSSLRDTQPLPPAPAPELVQEATYRSLTVSQQSMILSPLAPPQPRQHPPFIIAIVVLLMLTLLAGASASVYGMITGGSSVRSAQTSGTAIAQAARTATAHALAPGQVWHPQQIPDDIFALEAVVWGNSQFVAVGYTGGNNGSGAILTSPDGHNWTAQQLPPTVGFLNGITWGNSQFVAVGNDGTVGALLTSP